MSIWSADAANDWNLEQGWLVGCNLLPSSAINQLEMFQQDTFDLDTIKRELGWAKDLGSLQMLNLIQEILKKLR